MANDVIYPDGVTVSDAEHSALRALDLHPESGVAKADTTPLVEQARSVAESVVVAAAAEDAPTSAALDARTEAPQSWDGSERRSGSDRRVIDALPDGSTDRRAATADRRAEPPAKTEVDTTVTPAPEQEEATSVGEAPAGGPSVIESPLAVAQEDGSQADTNVEGAGLTEPAPEQPEQTSSPFPVEETAAVPAEPGEPAQAPAESPKLALAPVAPLGDPDEPGSTPGAADDSQA